MNRPEAAPKWLRQLTSIQLEPDLQWSQEQIERIESCASHWRMLMNQDRDNKWSELCRAAATEQDSSKLMELVAEIIKELDERARKLKSRS